MNYTELEQFKQKEKAGAGVLQRVTRRRVNEVSVASGMQDSLREARLNYRAGRPSNFRTTLIQLGGSADAHYRDSFEFWRIREYVRDYDRNTPILGQAVDRALDQVLGNGLTIDPNTGDKGVDAEITALWSEWSNDPEQCDFTWRQTIDEMERLALRHTFIDGDVFVILDDREGKVMLVEGDRVESSAGQLVVTSRSGEPIADLVHGVELDLSSRPIAYWFRKMKIGERQRRRRLFPTTDSEQMLRVIRDSVIHIYDPKRITQSRGMSAFHAVFERISMHEDVEFAQLVQQQVAACIAAFITSESNQQWGSRTNETGNDNETELVFDEFQPGMVTRLKPGENIETFSPRNPTGDALKLAQQIVREIGLALGLPLELAMLVTSDTTFHGYRGVVEAYKKTAKRQQSWYARRFRSRIYRWKVRQWVAQGLLTDSPTIAAHKVRCPAWKYVDPLKDAQGDSLRKKDHLASPRQIAAESGTDYDQMVVEIAADREALIKAAIESAERISKDTQETVTWRDILHPEESMPAPSTDDEEDEDDDEGQQAKAEPQEAASAA